MIQSHDGLRGKYAFVTGGGGGIGKAVAEALTRNGVHVAIVDIDKQKAEDTASRLESAEAQVLPVYCDVTDPESVNIMMETILAAFGRLDIAFNNAGISCNVSAQDMTFEQWSRVLAVNLTGVYLTCQAAGRTMIAQGGGAIINTASMSGHVVNTPQPQCAYNASKAGVIQLTKSLAVEWGPHNIRVNSISPGYISTEMTKAAPQKWKSAWENQTPMKRMGLPEELVGAVLYLASGGSSFTSGTDIIIDGAYTCI